MDLQQLGHRLTNIEKVLSEINNKLDNIQISTSSNNIKKPIKIKNFGEDLPSLEKKIVKKYLNTKNVIGDTNFLKLLLFKNIPKECYSIRNFDGRKNYQYYYNDKWIDDNGGDYIKKYLVKILEKYYLKANQFTNHSDMGDMVDNQKYINNLKTEKYMTRLLNNLKKFIII
jgi:hypothetical protein